MIETLIARAQVMGSGGGRSLKKIIPRDEYNNYNNSFNALFHGVEHRSVIHHVLNHFYPQYSIDVNLNNNHRLFNDCPHVAQLVRKMHGELDDEEFARQISELAVFYHRHRREFSFGLSDFCYFDYFSYLCVEYLTMGDFMSLISYCNGKNIILPIELWRDFLVNCSFMPLEWFLSLSNI